MAAFICRTFFRIAHAPAKSPAPHKPETTAVALTNGGGNSTAPIAPPSSERIATVRRSHDTHRAGRLVVFVGLATLTVVGHGLREPWTVPTSCLKVTGRPPNSKKSSAGVLTRGRFFRQDLYYPNGPGQLPEVRSDWAP